MWCSRGTQVPVRIGVLMRPGVSSGLEVPTRLGVPGAVESTALPESERAVSSEHLPGQPPINTGAIVLRAELNCTVSVLGRMDETCEMKYKVVDSPLGKLEISGCERGLHGIKLHGGKTPDTGPAEAAAPAEQLGGSGAVLEPLLQCAAWLDAYFREPAVLEGLPVPALHHPIFQKESFTRQVLWKLLTLVKFGETVSYQQLAALAGNPRAARAVGGAMRSNPIPILIPCHRVVCSSGAMGNYSGGVGVKEWLLAHEGRPAGKAARGGGSRATGSWRGALGSTASSQPAGRD
uniref:Methylated-DNA--protein-cysteine methyltransferase n=1 Tax=Bos indicus x Bos taurus TaxID=30522 RepID=A0A4W2GPU9_BOBOX